MHNTVTVLYPALSFFKNKNSLFVLSQCGKFRPENSVVSLIQVTLGAASVRQAGYAHQEKSPATTIKHRRGNPHHIPDRGIKTAAQSG